MEKKPKIKRNPNGTFQKGSVANPTGRSGVPGKVTAMTRELLNAKLEDNWEEFNARWSRLSDKDYVDVYMRVLGHIMPRATIIDVHDTRASALRDRLMKLQSPTNPNTPLADYEEVK